MIQPFHRAYDACSSSRNVTERLYKLFISGIGRLSSLSFPEANCVILITVSIAGERGAVRRSSDKKPRLIVTMPVNWPANRHDKFVRSAGSRYTYIRAITPSERVSFRWDSIITRTAMPLIAAVADIRLPRMIYRRARETPRKNY